MKKVLASLLALGVLGGVATGAYIYFQKPAQAAATEATAEVKKADDHAKAKKAKGGHGDGHGEAAPEFVKMTPLVVPLMDAQGVSQIISMVVTLEVASKDSVKQVETLMPRLKDAFIQDMYGTLSKKSVTEDGVLKVAVIKERLSTISQKVMGDEVVSGVLLEMVSQRPI